MSQKIKFLVKLILMIVTVTKIVLFTTEVLFFHITSISTITVMQGTNSRAHGRNHLIVT